MSVMYSICNTCHSNSLSHSRFPHRRPAGVLWYRSRRAPLVSCRSRVIWRRLRKASETRRVHPRGGLLRLDRPHTRLPGKYRGLKSTQRVSNNPLEGVSKISFVMSLVQAKVRNVRHCTVWSKPVIWLANIALHCEHDHPVLITVNIRVQTHPRDAGERCGIYVTGNVETQAACKLAVWFRQVTHCIQLKYYPFR